MERPMSKLLRLAEVAERLSCSLSNVHALTEAGLLPFHLIGVRKGKRVSEEDLAEYLARVRRDGQPEAGPLTYIR
jgi:excisionase family DNA binding protein